MSDEPTIASALELLVCARCRGPLSASELRVTCDDCGRTYPFIDGMPLLVADPHEELRQWSYQLHEFVEEIDASRDPILAQLAGERLLPTARARLQWLHDRLPEHRDRVCALFDAIGVRPQERRKADRPRVPGEGTITAYFHQVHRDWGWTDTDEFEAALDALATVVPARHRWGRTLVLGAGAARLVFEIARRWETGPIVALDLNPLPYLVARRVLRGESVALYELPMQPRTALDVMVDRTLRAPEPGPPDLSLVFADALDPPVAPAAFDTVLTPWFIDQVPPDLREFLPVVRRVLAPGGVWIDHGPCIYHPNHTRVAHRYRADEVLELVASAGFTLDAHDHRALPYMASPASDQGRTERVLSFFATKQPDEPDARPVPTWMTDVDAPIPVLAGLASYVPPHPMFAAVIALIDGRRSIEAIAGVLVERHGLPADAATMGVQGCLQEIVRALDPSSLADVQG
jgi:uncharacterized protein YbaR (Trm112 family)/SAM-dependent methyltransferase